MRRTRGTFLLNSPHNPTGWTMRVDEAARFGELCRQFDWAVILDHAYLGFEYESGATLPVAAWASELPDLWVAGSASKLLSSTGLRVGWLLTKPEHFAEALNHHMCLSYCQPQLLQQCVAALLHDFDYALPRAIVERYRAKRDLLVSALRERGLQLGAPEGGHFVLADYSALEPSLNPSGFARHLQASAGVVCLPAEPFYFGLRDRLVRFSFGVSMESIHAACRRLGSRPGQALPC
jgi:N-succinyldiaminopimelate aminotransferase/methionine aminotransferase